MELLLDRLAAALNPDRPEALLVGGQALPAYGVVRQTLDIDCLAAPPGATKLRQVLVAAGYAVAGQSAAVVRYRHESPLLLDVDVLVVSQETYDKLLRDSRQWRTENSVWRVPSLLHLIALKLHALKHNPARWGHDLADIASLLRLNPTAATRDEVATVSPAVWRAGNLCGTGEIGVVDQLTLPVFEIPVLPEKQVPLTVWRQINDEFVRRLKVSGEYDRLRQRVTHQPVPVPFQLN